MILISFTEEERQALNYERYHHPHPHVQRKMEVLWLKSNGVPHHEICRLAGISPRTLCNYLRDYQNGGIEKLKLINCNCPGTSKKKIKLIDNYYPIASNINHDQNHRPPNQ